MRSLLVWYIKDDKAILLSNPTATSAATSMNIHNLYSDFVIDTHSNQNTQVLINALGN